jgi:hypothetical protein
MEVAAKRKKKKKIQMSRSIVSTLHPVSGVGHAMLMSL